MVIVKSAARNGENDVGGDIHRLGFFGRGKDDVDTKAAWRGLPKRLSGDSGKRFWRGKR